MGAFEYVALDKAGKESKSSISKGVIDLRDLVYFGLLIGVMLYANTIVLQLTKAD